MFQVYPDIPDPLNSMVKPDTPQKQIPDHHDCCSQPWQLRVRGPTVVLHLCPVLNRVL